MPRIIGITQAKRDFSKIALEVSQSKIPVLVLKGSKPVVQITPVQHAATIGNNTVHPNNL